MNKDFHEVSLQAASYDKVNKVVIYTNGTICPPDAKLEQLKNDKIFVFITTYGELSKNAEKLRAKLEQFGIQHNYQPAYGWTECGGIKIWDRTPNDNLEIFQELLREALHDDDRRQAFPLSVLGQCRTAHGDTACGQRLHVGPRRAQ